MLLGAKIGKSYTLNTKIAFISLFEFILPIFGRFQKSLKIVIFEISYFWPKNNFEPFWSYINFKCSDENHLKPKYLPKLNSTQKK